MSAETSQGVTDLMHKADSQVTGSFQGAAQSSCDERDASKEARLYSTNDVYFLLSLTFFWAWIFLVFFSNVSVVALQGFETASGFVLKGCAMFGQVFFLVCALVLTRKDRWVFLGSDRRSLAACALSGSLINIAALVGALGVPIPAPAALLCWFLMGLGEVYVLIHVSRAFRELEAKTKIIAVAAATMIAGLGFGVAITIQGVASIIVSAGTFLLALAFAHACSFPFDQLERGEDVPGEVLSTAGCKPFFISFLFFSYVFGMALSLGVALAVEHGADFALCIAICLASMLLILNALFLYERIGVERVLWILLPVVSLGLLPLPFIDSTGRIVCCVLLIAGFTAYDMLSMPRVEALARKRGLPLTLSSIYARLANALGIFFGWATGGFFYLSGLFYRDAFVMYSLGLILLLVLLMTFSSRPVESLRDQTDEIAADQTPKWAESCEEVGRRFGLSPREQEVFILLAKGRDAVFISEYLRISVHTAKSHIYHIYGKCGIHNRQEIIDYIERYRHREKNEQQSLDAE